MASFNTVCIYDDDAIWDSNVFWNGDCGIETVTGVIRRADKSQQQIKIECHIEATLLAYKLHGVVVPVRSRTMEFDCSEDELDQLEVLVRNIKHRTSNGVEFVVTSVTRPSQSQPLVELLDARKVTAEERVTVTAIHKGDMDTPIVKVTHHGKRTV